MCVSERSLHSSVPVALFAVITLVLTARPVPGHPEERPVIHGDGGVLSRSVPSDALPDELRPLSPAQATGRARAGGRGSTVLWMDDMESGAAGWRHWDYSWALAPHFHIDDTMAFEGQYSWWCGSFEYDLDGGYGNGWDDRLELPAVDLSGAAMPVLTFAHYYHSEPDVDQTYIQALDGGSYADLNAGFSGLIPGGTWLDVGVYGYLIDEYDDPFVCRFRFVSDGADSDEDGGFDSAGGAYRVDNIRVFDFPSGVTLFLDDAESGGLCNPNIPEFNGDYWHLVERRCAATSDPTCWWCGDDADTSLIPPLLDNWLESPPVDISGLDAGTPCTVRYWLHAEVPTVDNDYWSIYASVDGGESFYQLRASWGDYGSCDGWDAAGIAGHAITDLLPGDAFKFMIRFFTTDDGCGPGAAGGAGIMLDDVMLVAGDSPVERTTWGALKALYRQRTDTRVEIQD